MSAPVGKWSFRVVEFDDGRAKVSWFKGVPTHLDECQFYDGKRCELMGVRPAFVCDPVVTKMSDLLDDAEASS